MVQNFIIITAVFSLVTLWKKNTLNLRCAFTVFLISLITYFLISCYLATDMYICINLQYNYTQLLNFFLITLFNVNWTNLYLLVLIAIIYIIFRTVRNSFNPLSLFITSNSLQYFILFVWYSFQKNFSEFYYTVLEKLSFFKNFLPDINFLLLNNLVLVHPILTHMLYSYFLFYGFCGFYFWFLLQKKHRNTFMGCKLKDTKIIILPFYFFSIKQVLSFLLVGYLMIFLGSLWAAQELVWNNWWNWDIIEIIAFSFFLANILFTHALKKKTSFTQNYINAIISTILFFLFYFFIRLDVSASLHSFNLFDAIEIYLYLFCIIFLYCNYILLKNKNMTIASFTKIISKKNKNVKTFFNLNFFFKTFVLSLYLYCFITWFNDNETYIIKNEIIWTYSLIYKYILFYFYVLYYFYIIKLNWFLIFILAAATLIFLFLYFFSKFLKISLTNFYLFMHSMIYVYLLFLVTDSLHTILSYTINSFGENNLIFINRKIFFFYPDNKLSLFFDLLLNKIVCFKYNYNSTFIYKLNYLLNNRYTVIYWHEQTYNFYLNTNTIETILINFYFKENNLIIFMNKMNHYLLISVSVMFTLVRLIGRKKKLKILI